MSESDLFFWGLMFGAVGMGYFIYGKNMSKLVPMLSGIGLCVFQYLITSPLPFFLVGGALVLLPAFFGRE